MTTEVKRGRPNSLSDSFVSKVQELWPEIKTRRGMLNKSYELRAWGIVRRMQKEKHIEELEFLRDDAKQYINTGVCRELGKFETDEEIEEFIPAVCAYQKKAQMTIHQWCKLLSEIRLDGIKETVSDIVPSEFVPDYQI